MKTINTIIKYLFNRKAIKDPKPLNTTTLKYFVQGHLREFGKNFNIVDEHILEQASWRSYQVKEKSPICHSSGQCVHCECSLNETLLSDPACKHGCFPIMKSKDEWTLYKQNNNTEYVNNSNNK